MQQKNKFDMPFCGLTKKLKPTGTLLSLFVIMLLKLQMKLKLQQSQP